MLKSLRSTAIAAFVLAFDIAALTLFLNPLLDPRAEAPALVRALVVPYAVVLFMGFAVLAACLTFVRGVRSIPRPLLTAFPWLSTSSLLAASGAAALFALNLEHHRYSLPVESVRAMLTTLVCLGGAALTLLGVIVDSWFFAGRSRGGSAALVVLAVGVCVVAPLQCLPSVGPPNGRSGVVAEPVTPARRIFFVGFDGVSPQMLQAAIDRGHASPIARLMREGAWAPLAPIRPAEEPPVWSSLWTGRLPRDHGVKAGVQYTIAGSTSTYELLPKGIVASRLERAGLVRPRPVDGRSLRAKPLWQILRAFSIPVGLSGLWGTHPVEPIPAFVVSDRFAALADQGTEQEGSLYPSTLLASALPRVVRASDLEPAFLSRFVSDAAAPESGFAWRRDLIDRALVPDLTADRVGSQLRETLDPAFYAVYFRGPDVVGHPFLRFSRPEAFGDVTPADARRFGEVVDVYLDVVGETVERLAKARRPQDIVVVVSAYGLVPMSPWRRFLQASTGLARDSATHEWGPPGFLVVAGEGIAPRASPRTVSVLDVAPTLLYLMGVPLARDLDGGVLFEFLDEDFAKARPITYVPSYDDLVERGEPVSR